MLLAVDQHAAAVLALCGVALCGNYIYWFENLRLGFRDKRYSMPVPCLFFFLLHDATFVFMRNHWFGTLHHWFPELWWGGLCVTVALECGFLVMLLMFGPEELAPCFHTLVWNALGVAAVAGGAANLVFIRALDKQKVAFLKKSSAKNF